MSAWLARLIVRLSAWLVPSDRRAAWREEWLSELDAARRARNFTLQRNNFKLLRSSVGAPADALAMRRIAAESHARFHGGQWANDVRYTTRLLSRSPGYVAMVVLGLSVGMTAVIVVLSGIQALFRGELVGIEDRASIARVSLSVITPDGYRVGYSGFTFSDLDVMSRQHGPLIRDVAGEGRLKMTIRAGGDTLSAVGAFVNASYFQTLGTQPVAGRVLLPPDDRPDASVAVISERLWRTAMGARHDAIGDTIVVGDRKVRVIGVVPWPFNGYGSGWSVRKAADMCQVWLPLAMSEGWPAAPGRDANWLDLMFRLAPGIDRKTAASRLDWLALALEPNPERGRALSVRVQDMGIGDAGDDPESIAGAAGVLLAAPLALLAIGCANVANLRLARATARTRELAVRISLGATRRQITRLLLIEAVILTALALGVSVLGMRILVALLAARFVAIPFRIDILVAVLSVALSALVVFASGLLPAWLVTRRATAAGLKQSAQSGGIAHAKLRHTLVVVQVAISLVLLTMGSLLTRSVAVVNNAQPNVIEHLLAARLDLGSQGYTAADAARFASALLTRLHTDAAYSNVALGQFGPFGAPDVLVRASGGDAHVTHTIGVNKVTPGWFAAMSLTPIVGQVFTIADREDVIIVNETAAHLLAPLGSPVGMSVMLRDSRSEPREVAARVIAVVPDSFRRPDRPLSPLALAYLPLDISHGQAPLSMTLLARADRPGTLARDITHTIAAIEPRMPWTNVETVSGQLDDAIDASRTLAVTANAAGLVALVLAAAGLFSVMAYMVSLKTREIGIRIALGAHPGSVVHLVLRQCVTLIAVGVAIGLAIILPIAQLIRAVFLGVSPFDPIALLPVLLIFGVTAVIAGALPARRAAAVDPVQALRAE